MVVWFFALVVGGRYLVDPPSTDPAADLGRTVLAIIEGTVADRLRLLRNIYVTSLVKAAIHAATRANGVAEAKSLSLYAPSNNSKHLFRLCAVPRARGGHGNDGKRRCRGAGGCHRLHRDARGSARCYTPCPI